MTEETRDIFAYATALGWDGEAARQSFLNDRIFYIKCLKELLNEPVFQVLLQEGRRERCVQIFPAAHYLKGSAGVLGLTSMSAVLGEITECLRGKGPAEAEKEEICQDSSPVWATLTAEHQKLQTAVESLEA